MKFTIVMQSLLADYPNSASNKPDKFIRAVNSVLSQTYKDWELLIISDNCNKTFDTFIANFSTSDRIRLFLHKDTEQRKGWHSYCRNIGIEKATGDYVLYLDIDDLYEEDYLQRLSEVITDNPLYFADDITLFKMGRQQRKVNLKKFMCGTSNIIHRADCKSRWQDVSRYASEDFEFIQSLIAEFPNYEILTIAGYVVCHIPKKYDL